jgi:hypothetical protein
MSRKDKGRLPPFVPLLNTTIDSPAWKAASHGAKWLYVTLKRKANSGHKAYLSSRAAERELKSSRRKVREWCAELEHYGFIRQLSAGHLGVDGHGKAPHWRLTEKGCTSKVSPDGLFEPPPNDFLKWDGELFDPKPYRSKPGLGRLKNPGDDAYPRVETTHTPPLETTHHHPSPEGGDDAYSIQTSQGGDDACSISSLTTPGESPEEAPTSPPASRLFRGEKPRRPF